MNKGLAVVLLVGIASAGCAATADDGAATRAPAGSKAHGVRPTSDDWGYPEDYAGPEEEPPVEEPPMYPPDYTGPEEEPAPAEPTTPTEPNYQMCPVFHEEDGPGYCWGWINELYYTANVFTCTVIEALEYSIPVETGGEGYGDPHCKQKVRCDVVLPLPAGQGAISGQDCVPVVFP